MMLDYTNAPWSLTIYIGLPLAALCVLLLLACLVWGVIGFRKNEGLDRDGWAIMVVLSVLCLIPLVLGVLYGFYPYEKQYHAYAKVEGTVDVIDSRLFAGKSSSEKYTVRFEGSNQQYACVDTRCANVREGDELGLSCVRVFEYAAEDGYDCRFLYATPNN